MGVVYRARQVTANRLVALKMIRAGAGAGDRERERFRTEARAAARLHHPNIVQVYEMGEEGGQPFFALEYVDGESLDRRLQRGAFPPAEAARLVRTLARAVEAAHRQGVIHRDLKPANVLLAADGTPKIADFGLAKILDEAGQTQTGDVMGTASYMAPEQARGEARSAGPAADVYALGAILYALLTGRPPFQGANRLATLEQVRTLPPLPPRQRQPGCPRDLEAICLTCLEKAPGRRYAGAENLAEDLERFLAGELTRARPPALWRRALLHQWRFGPGSRGTVSVLEVLFLVGLVVPAALWAGLASPGLLSGFSMVGVLLLYLVLKARLSRPSLALSQPDPGEEAPGGPDVRHENGWLTVPWPRLRFPLNCAGCGSHTTATLVFQVRGWGHFLKLCVPVCETCQARDRRRALRGAWPGAAVGLVGALALTVWYGLACDLKESGPWVALLACGAVGGAIIGFLVGWAAAIRYPVKWRSYSWRKGTIALRFRHPGYAQKVVAVLQAAQSRPKEPSPPPKADE
jgi:hypothetical protein